MTDKKLKEIKERVCREISKEVAKETHYSAELYECAMLIYDDYGGDKDALRAVLSIGTFVADRTNESIRDIIVEMPANLRRLSDCVNKAGIRVEAMVDAMKVLSGLK